jgi:site-specific recombinase XerD
MSPELIDNPLVSDWLAEKRSTTTRRSYLYRLRLFLEYHKITPNQLLEMSPKEARTLALRYQNENTELSNNTLLGRLTAVASFMDYYDKPINWKRGTRVRPRPDTKSHVYTNGDLSKMFEVADTRDKAILALATSLGWEISGFVDLKRETLRKLIARTKETGEQFVYFRNIRNKTGKLRLGVLNPLAIEWCEKWLKLSENIPKREREPRTVNPITLTAKRRISDIFDLTGNGIHGAMRSLAKKANLKLTGKPRFHNIRKWVMSGLSRSGFNEFQIKYVLGKAIPMSDQVYLQTLEDEIRERCPEAYENYLNLSTTISKNVKKKIEDENKILKEKFAEMKLENEKTKEQIKELSKTVNALLGKLENLTEK